MWIDDIALALQRLNGIAEYNDLYREIENIKNERNEPLVNDWHAVVRRTIQQNSSDSQSWLKRRDLFYSVDGLGHGKWGLRDYYPKEYSSPEFAKGNVEPERKDTVISR